MIKASNNSSAIVTHSFEISVPLWSVFFNLKLNFGVGRSFRVGRAWLTRATGARRTIVARRCLKFYGVGGSRGALNEESI